MKTYENNVVITPIYLTRNRNEYTKTEFKILDKMHKEKIKISNAVYIVNVNGYIGSSTKSEIEYSKKLGKEILIKWLEEK